MAITVNGQPPSNTVVRLDGVTQINQFFQQIQAYSPSLEAIETVSVVTSSFDADQGMAGGASVNVQVKSGTNTVAGSAFDHMTDYRMKAKNYFLPNGDPKGTGNTQVYGGTIGGPVARNKVFLLRERRTHTAAHRRRQCPVEFQRQRPAQPTDDGHARRQLSRAPDRAVRSAHRRGQRDRARTVCVRELSGLTSTADPRFDSCNYIPANRINPISRNLLSKLVAPTLPGFTNNYFATNSYDTDYNKYDGKITWVPNGGSTSTFDLGMPTVTKTARRSYPPSTVALIRFSRVASGTRRFTVIRWR
jgi:hypothetical protein